LCIRLYGRAVTRIFASVSVMFQRHAHAHHAGPLVGREGARS